LLNVILVGASRNQKVNGCCYEYVMNTLPLGFIKFGALKYRLVQIKLMKLTIET
jgi:hypothetical protein